MQKLNARIVSFFLILAFTQKMGLELWLHNWLHETTVSVSVRSVQKGKPLVQHQPIKCSCIDDTLAPLVESDLVDCSPDPRPSTALFATVLFSWFSVDKEFSPLRGPPATGYSL